jgi:GNAT superfamily N-acetyltransferase
MHIRRGVSEDAVQVASVLKNAFIEYEPAYTKEGYAATTPEAPTILQRIQEGPLWVAHLGDEIVGTAAAVNKEAGLYIRGMAVLPTARGHNLGRLLLEEVEFFATQERCRRLFLSTTPFLNRAIRLYTDYGFQFTSEGPHDLFGTPLFTMEKVLT